MLLTAEDVNRKRNRPFTLSALKFPAVRVISAVIRFNWNESEARRSRREVGHQSESQIKFRGFAARSTSACWTSHSSSFPSTVRELKEDGRHTYTAHVELIGSVTRLWPVILRKLRHCNVSERFVCLQEKLENYLIMKPVEGSVTVSVRFSEYIHQFSCRGRPIWEDVVFGNLVSFCSNFKYPVSLDKPPKKIRLKLFKQFHKWNKLTPQKNI